MPASTASPRARASSPILKELGLLESIEDITHAVGVCDRCKSDSRAAHFHAVVHENEAARRAGEASGARRPDRSGPRQPAHDSAELARKHSRLVHLAPALVGPSHSHLALRRLQGNGSGDAIRASKLSKATRAPPASRRNARSAAAQSSRRIPMCSTRGSAPACGRFPRSAGRTTRRICARSIPRAC